nr:hypothetical protein [Ornithinimicrobium flavum]
MGNLTLAMSVAPALGPTVSGIVLELGSWRWLFGLVLPIAVLVTVVGVRMLGGGAPGRPARLDLVSVVLTAVGFGGLVYGLSAFGKGSGGGSGATPLLVLLVGLVTLASSSGARWCCSVAASPSWTAHPEGPALRRRPRPALPGLHGAHRDDDAAADRVPGRPRDDDPPVRAHAPARGPDDGAARAGRGPALRPVRAPSARGARCRGGRRSLLGMALTVQQAPWWALVGCTA